VALVGLVLVATIGIATWLTFARDSSMGAMSMGPTAASMADMNMDGSTMSGSTCSLVSTTALDRLLGTIVQAPTFTASRLETTCDYALPGSEQRLTIRYTMKVARSDFERGVPREAASSGTPVRHAASLGDASYWAPLGSGASTGTVLAVLKGSNQMVVAGPLTPAQAQQVATEALPRL
jgi:hypothetical protein